MCPNAQKRIVIIISCTFRWTVLSVSRNRVLLLWFLFKWIESPNWRFNWICSLKNGIHEKVVNLSFVLDPLKVQVQPIAVAICVFALLPTWSGQQIDCRILSAFAFDIDAPNWLYHVLSMYPYATSYFTTSQWLFRSCCNSLFRSCSALCHCRFGVEKCTRI